MSEDDDGPQEALLKRVSEGDEIAQKELCDRYALEFERVTKDKLFGTGCWARDVHGREISQSFWAIIFKDPASLAGVKSFVAWSHRVLRNLVLEHVSGPKACKKAPVPIDDLELRRKFQLAIIYPDHVTMESGVLCGEILEKAKKIRPEFHQILVLHVFEGFTHEEIAAKLDMTPNSVRLIYSRGLRELRPFLGDRETMARSGALQLRTEPPRCPPSNSPTGSVDGFTHDLNGSSPRLEPEEPGLNARNHRAPQSRAEVNDKQRRLYAHRRRKEGHRPIDGSGKRRTR